MTHAVPFGEEPEELTAEEQASNAAIPPPCAPRLGCTAACPSPRISGAGPKARTWMPWLGKPEIREGGGQGNSLRSMLQLIVFLG